jgi:dihydroorotate dehydrogenase
MYSLLKSLLFLMPAERAHHTTTGLLNFLSSIPGIPGVLRSLFVVRDSRLERELFGLTFPNPVGLAAGFDKNADYLHSMQHLGFGFIEIGTVTPKGQPGNPQPRLFRLKQDHGLINRMGFNNDGMEAAIKKLKNRPKNLIVGGNIGKNKVTPNEEATSDYLKCFDALFEYVDYFVVNVSSPNTPDLRQLQDKEPLTKLLGTLQKRNEEKQSRKPILLKIAPDLTDSQLDDILEIADETKIDGLIASNTTISRDGLTTEASAVEAIGAGGLSGQPVRTRSTEVIRYLRDRNKDLPIIGVGGIDGPDSAKEKLAAGANLIQIYTGFVYQGPALIKRINQAILKDIN